MGTGGWTNAGHLAVYGTHPRAKLMAICDIDKDRARGAARMFDVEIVTDDYSVLVNRDDIDAIEEGNDHTTDALRYMTYSRKRADRKGGNVEMGTA